MTAVRSQFPTPGFNGPHTEGPIASKRGLMALSLPKGTYTYYKYEFEGLGDLTACGSGTQRGPEPQDSMALAVTLAAGTALK